MNKLALLLLCIAGVSTGCAHVPKTGNPAAEAAPERHYKPAVAAALAFDPPVSMYEPQLSFARDGRSNAAFMGYEQTTVDQYYLYQRDQQRGGDFPDRFERTAYTSRSSTTFR